MRQRLVVRQLVGELRGLAGPAQEADRGERAGARSGRQKTST